jgi:hypothetical protein
MNFIKSFFGRPRSSFSVGDIIYNENSRKMLLLEKEVYICNNKHFSASMEHAGGCSSTFLSEEALHASKYVKISIDKKVDGKKVKDLKKLCKFKRASLLERVRIL